GLHPPTGVPTVTWTSRGLWPRPRPRTALRLEPRSSEAANNLGLVVLAQGKTDEAILQLREAIRLKPDYAMAWNNLGNALRERGRFGHVGRSGDGSTPTLIAPGAARQAGQKNSCHRDHDSRRKPCVHHLLSLVRPTIRTALCTRSAWKRGVGGRPSL